VRTKEPQETYELEWSGLRDGPRVLLDFGPLVGPREFSLSDVGQGRCMDRGCGDYVIDQEDLERLRKE